ncbi:MAG: hypothetical protein ACI9G6_002437, partial [Limisphaerales bacterium]
FPVSKSFPTAFPARQPMGLTTIKRAEFIARYSQRLNLIRVP